MADDGSQGPRQYGLERQTAVYFAGLQGQRPALPVSPELLEQQASERLTPEAWGYLSGMADTMRANRAAFERWRIVPRMLRDVSRRDLSVRLLGRELPAPILLAPIGVQSIVHPDAEVAVARAAAAVGVPLILSMASSKSIEEVAQAIGPTEHWFQLYWSRDPALNASVVARAERAGYGAIVVTLDTYLLAWREQDIQNAYLPFLLGEGLANYLGDPAFRRSLDRSPEQDPAAAIRRVLEIYGHPALTWDDLASLRQHTTLPILLKGIMHPDDARQAVERGMDGIIVSNHGGRQVSGARAALDALPEVVATVDGRIPVLFDSGMRRASDVLKAVALGASAVLLGRPYVWALGLSGQQGVEEFLRNVLADLDLTLALSGHTSYASLDASALVRDRA